MQFPISRDFEQVRCQQLNQVNIRWEVKLLCWLNYQTSAELHHNTKTQHEEWNTTRYTTWFNQSTQSNIQLEYFYRTCSPILQMHLCLHICSTSAVKQARPWGNTPSTHPQSVVSRQRQCRVAQQTSDSLHQQYYLQPGTSNNSHSTLYVP